jgi:NADH:ubiquinone oxidoreductase subunit 3 (subunit A)
MVAGILFGMFAVYALLFSSVFWTLTFLAKWVYSEKYYNLKVNFYECGFKSLTKMQISYDINYLTIGLFIMIYDSEFLVLIPYASNLPYYSIESAIAIIFFFFGY